MCACMQERSADKDIADSKKRKESPDAKDIESRVSFKGPKLHGNDVHSCVHAG